MTADSMAAGSQRGRLRQRIERQRDEATWDLEIPETDPPLYIRVKALPYRKIASRAVTEEQVLKDPDIALRNNAAILIDACIGIFELDANGKPVSIDPDDPDGPWLTFRDTQRLCELFELDVFRSFDVVTKILTEWGTLKLADEVGRRSGYDQTRQVQELGKD